VHDYPRSIFITSGFRVELDAMDATGSMDSIVATETKVAMDSIVANDVPDASFDRGASRFLGATCYLGSIAAHAKNLNFRFATVLLEEVEPFNFTPFLFILCRICIRTQNGPK